MKKHASNKLKTVAEAKKERELADLNKLIAFERNLDQITGDYELDTSGMEPMPAPPQHFVTQPSNRDITSSAGDGQLAKNANGSRRLEGSNRTTLSLMGGLVDDKTTLLMAGDESNNESTAFQ